MGDSFCVALGQYEDFNNEVTETNRWTNLVAAYYNLEHYNSGIGGCGNYTVLEHVYRDVSSFVQQGKNPLVIICYSDPNRVELFHKEHDRPMVINEIQWEPEFYKSFITNYEKKQANIDQSIIYIAAVQSFLLRHNIDFVDCHSFTDIIKDPLIIDHTRLSQSLYDIAGNEGKFIIPVYKHSRYGHPNVLGNKLISEKIIEKINNLYG
jgi:hypothetical protein